MTTRYVPARVPLLDPRTGLISREWYLFFQTMMDPGAGEDDDTALLLSGALFGAIADAPADVLDLAPYLADGPRDDLAARTEYREPEDDLSPPLYPSAVNKSDVIDALGYTPASAGANSDITSLAGLTTALSVAQGGTGRTTISPILMATRFSGYTTPFQTIATAFSTVLINSAPIDNAAGFNTGTGLYTVPAGEGGLYLVTGKIKLVDGAQAGVSWATAVGINSNDTVSASAWTSTVATTAGSGTTRNVQTTTRLMLLAPGDQVRLYAYVDLAAGLGVTGAELALFKL